MTAMHHHPKNETLALFAAGALDEARAVVIATHLELCAGCRRAVRDFEALGGACLESAADVAPMSADAMTRFWARAGEAAPDPLPVSTRADNDVAPDFTAPLQRYLKGGVDAAAWRSVAPGVAQCIVELKSDRRGALRLLKFAPGMRVPKHTHGGGELTLVLKGAYRDEIGAFGPGDLADLDGEHTHSPLAYGDEPCVCLIATNAPLKFTGLIGKVVQPLAGL